MRSSFTKTINNFTHKKLLITNTNFHTHTFNKNFCELFGNFISRKSGQKCCQYGQNGKPLKAATVIKYLDRLGENYGDWQPNEDFTRLNRVFYFKNVFSLTDFIKELYLLDYNTNLQQIPNVSVINREIVKVELYTPLLKGLAAKDLQLASAINTINFEKFQMIPIKDEKNYKKDIRKLQIIEDESNKNRDSASIEKSRLKNKYDGISYEVSNEMSSMANIDSMGGCSNPDGCGCKENKYQL